MNNYSTDNQITYITQWFRTWSDFQKDDFVRILAQKINPSQFINGIVNGMQNIDTSGRPPSLFYCQVKLFKEWWDSWNEPDREKLKTQLKESDAKFWTEVESELNGTRAKPEDDFFTVTITATAASAGVVDENDDVSEQNDEKEAAEPDGKIQQNGNEKLESSSVAEEGAIV